MILTCEFPDVEEQGERWMGGEEASTTMQRARRGERELERARERERWGIRSDDPAGMRAERYFTGHQACFSLTCSLEKEIDFCPTRPLILLSWLVPVQRHSYIWKPLRTYAGTYPHPLWFHTHVGNGTSPIHLFMLGENNHPLTFWKKTQWGVWVEFFFSKALHQHQR